MAIIHFDRRREFVGSTSGNIVLTFALLLLPLAIGIGSAIDYGRSIQAREAGQSALDAAVVAVMAQDLNEEKAVSFAKKFFTTNIPASYNIRQEDIQVTYDYKADENSKEISMSFTAPVATTFLKVVGIDSITVGGRSKASNGIAKYSDISIFVDTSDSMGLAADAANRTLLKTVTNTAYKAGQINSAGDNCEFACHRNSGNTTTLAIARSNGVKLRIDSAKSGIQELIKLAIASNDKGGRTRIAIDAFSTTILPIIGMTDDMSAVSTATNGLEVGGGAAATNVGWGLNWCYTGFANTWFNTNAPIYANTVRSRIADAGVSQSYVVLVTDGLNSQNCAASVSKDDVYPFRPVDCDVIKATGATLAVIYTEYMTSTSNTYKGHARHAVEPSFGYVYQSPTKSPGIEANLLNCASPGFFAKAADPADIDTAFRNIFTTIKLANRIVN